MRTLMLAAATSVALLGTTARGAAAQQQDIVGTAVAAGSFNTLAKALTAAGLVETLQGAGPFTVFAPTDEAFAKLPAGALDKLLADKAALRQVLLYHVVPGKVMAADVVKLSSAKTAAGPSARVQVMNGTVMINNAHVVKADVAASNGVIHVIDAVIMPPMGGAGGAVRKDGR